MQMQMQNLFLHVSDDASTNFMGPHFESVTYPVENPGLCFHTGYFGARCNRLDGSHFGGLSITFACTPFDSKIRINRNDHLSFIIVGSVRSNRFD